MLFLLLELAACEGDEFWPLVELANALRQEMVQARGCRLYGLSREGWIGVHCGSVRERFGGGMQGFEVVA